MLIMCDNDADFCDRLTLSADVVYVGPGISGAARTFLLRGAAEEEETVIAGVGEDAVRGVLFGRVVHDWRLYAATTTIGET